MTLKILCAASMLALIAAAPATAPAGKPTYGSFGFDAAGKDPAVKPGDDFYQYANGGWERATPIPDDRSNYGMFTALDDLSQQRTRGIIEAAAGAPGSEAAKVGDWYRSFMDEAAIERAGLAPVAPMLAVIDGIGDRTGLTRALAGDARRFVDTPFTAYVGQDERAPDTHIGILTQGGLGLPDRDMYEKAQFADARRGYQAYIARLFTLAGLPDAEARAKAVYDLEAKMAAAHWTVEQNRDPQKTYNKLTPAQLAALAPGFDWAAYLQGVGLGGQPAVNVGQPTAFAAMARLTASEPLAVWKDYLRLRLLDEAAPNLPKAFVDARFDFYGKTLSGTPQQRPRWQRGVAQVTDTLGEAVGKLYVDRYFPPETKARADRLVRNLLAAMQARLEGLDWMSPETRARALEKLATYDPKIGYPTRWRDYSALEVRAGDPVGNALRASAFDYDRRLAKLGQPVDRTEWEMTPMTVNAYYNPVKNEIVFPAAILQPPFFDPNADDAVNYGAIGTVIGHEISHGFDDQGSQYDAKGALRNWWTDADRARFKAATDRLVAQYNGYCPFPAADGKPAQCVNGATTLGENIADLAGLTIAWEAYKVSLNGRPAPVIDGMTAEQRFFLGYAQIWRRSYRDAELRNRLVTDVHSPSRYRTATVRNIDRWYDAFGAKPGERLYLSPKDRVKIW